MAAFSARGLPRRTSCPWAMVPDVIIDRCRRASSARVPTTPSPSFFQKLATGAALWMMAQAFASTGYLTPTSAMAVPVQPPAAVLAIRLLAGPYRHSCWCWRSCAPGSTQSQPSAMLGACAGRGA